ncbi:MAG TPA: hypothetical protein VMS64_38545 [Candidatus Methylomirabilis sp.]|nr:hypothetical protein [Candidatus Methylomirabilis sp.]
MKYRVLIDDNFHFMDESARYQLGEFDTRKAAVAACKKVVDDCLTATYQLGMPAATLLLQYKMSGDDPWIAGGRTPVKFSAWSYAEARALEMCGS